LLRQWAIQAELKGVPAYSEGWGLFSEKLAKDTGLYTDPALHF
jgi:uncharacterized protein (DUF885 family)